MTDPKNEPDRLYIRKTDRNDYKRLLEKDSPFNGKENKNLFMLAMIIGLREGQRVPLGEKWGFVRTEYLTEEEKSIIKAITIAEEGSLEVLMDMKNVYSIAEEYAAGGIKLLKDKALKGYGSYTKKLEAEMLDEINKIKKNNSTERLND